MNRISWLKSKARSLRNDMTEAETRLWYEIRRNRLGVRFYRQRILCGFIIDFYSPKAQLVIELDGGHHFGKEKSESDRKRDSILVANGYSILRFQNDQVLTETTEVLERIWLEIEKTGFRKK